MFNIPLRYWGYLTLCISSFSWGWFSSYNYYKVKQSKIDIANVNAQLARKDKIINLNNQNQTNINNASQELNQKIKGLNYTTNKQLSENKNAKNILNNNNTITIYFLCSVGATSGSICVSNNATTTSGVKRSNRTIPAYDYTKWALGLKFHDNECVLRYNTLLKIYQEQQKVLSY